MTQTIKFNRYNVTNGTDTARVTYHHATLTNGRECVTLYAKDYDRALGKILPDQYENNTDSMTDYFEHGRVRIYADSPLFAAAKARCDQNDKLNAERWEKKQAKRAAYRAECQALRAAA